MNKVLLDTDNFSEVGKGVDLNVVRNAQVYYQQYGRLTLSVVTVMEVVKGLHEAGRPQKIQMFLTQVVREEFVGLTISAAEIAGRIEADLKRTGQPIGVADSLIAGIAIDAGLKLASGNIRHYQRIQKLGHPLMLVNWRT